MRKMLSTSESTSSLFNIARAGKVKLESGSASAETTPFPTVPTLASKIEMILTSIPPKAGVRATSVRHICDELVELLESEVSKAVEATESRIRAKNSSTTGISTGVSKSEGLSRDEFTELFRAGIREMVPELVRLSGENSARLASRGLFIS